MEGAKTLIFTTKVAEFRKTDSQIDWSDIKVTVGRGRVAHFSISEVESD